MTAELSRTTTAQGFRRTYASDRQRGQTRPLAEYLRLFPGDEVTVAEEYLTFQRDHDTSHSDFREVPPTLGQYHLEHELGRGGQARVFLAEDIRLRRKVALKVLALGEDDAEEVLLRFRREAEATSQIHHSGICPIYDTGSENGFGWIAMRYVEGESLAQRIRRSRMGDLKDDDFISVESGELGVANGWAPGPEFQGPSSRADIREMVHLIETSARAVHAAHDAGVIHRDLKPGNIMVTPEGQAVVLDFGLARRIEDARHGITTNNSLFGSPAYAAPEQFERSKEHAEASLDVWGLGVTLFESLTYRRPFRAGQREGLIRAIREDETPSARSLNPLVHSDLDAIIRNATSKDPLERYASALAFAEDLRRFLDYEPIAAQPASTGLQLRRWCRRRPRTAMAMASFLVVLMTSLIVSLSLWHNETTQSQALEETLQALEEENRLRRELVKELEKERREKEAFFELALEAVLEGEPTQNAQGRAMTTSSKPFRKS